jgi:hypothetical protein
MRSLFALLIIACGTPHAEEPVVVAPPVEVGQEAEHETPLVAIHEWGLIDVDLTNGIAELSTGPGQEALPVMARKPVLYLHVLDGDTQSLTVRARIPGGQILEHWPPGQLGPYIVTWNVDLRRGVCGPERGPVARDVQAACSSTDGFCETNELPRYATDDHDCMDVGGTQANLLFYRASIAADRLPLRFARNADRTVSVMSTTDGWDRPREMLRTFSGSISRAPMPGNGQTASMPVPSAPIDPTAEREAMMRTLAELGLTPSEANAFMNAWQEELFGGSTIARRRPAPPADVILYWLAQSDVHQLAAIDTSPTPITLSRAFLVRVTLPPG